MKIIKHKRNAQLRRYCKIDKSASEKLFYKYQVTWRDVFNIGVELVYKSDDSILQTQYLRR